jgi:transcriptional regulator with XRE-family HTH domain
MDLLTFRLESGESREQFGARVGVSGVTVWRWEKGVDRPSWPKMDAIFAATNGKVTAADFARPTKEPAAEAAGGAALE